MKKTIIIYFTKTGNNRFIAEKLSKDLDADLTELIPKLNNFFLLLILSGLKIPSSIKTLSLDIKKYERVILISPIWIGSLISPIRGFVKKYKDSIKDLVFITVCGSGSEDKDGKYGYENIFKEVQKYFPSRKTSCYEISTKSLNKNNQSSKALPIISENVFNNEIKDRYDEIVEILKKEVN